MSQEITVTSGSGSVFEDLGFVDAEEHQVKAGLVGEIADIMEQRKMTQIAAAELLGIDQPKVSAMLNGRFRGFSVYRLMNFLAALGTDVEIVTKERAQNGQARRSGHITVKRIMTAQSVATIDYRRPYHTGSLSS